VHIDFALDALTGLGQRLEYLKPLMKMGNRFHMG
jgi:hypothetical protein